MKRNAYTLLELLVSVAVCAVLLAIFVPVLAGARESARRGKCLANLRSIATVSAEYLDYHRVLPTADDVPDVAALRCPSAKLPDEGGYAFPVVFAAGFGQAPATTFFGRTLSMDPSKVSLVHCWRHEPQANGFLDGGAR